MKTLLLATVAALTLLSPIDRAEGGAGLVPPHSGTLRVAFVVSDRATVIDYSGPWDVFESTQLDDNPFQLYTVAPSKEPIHTSGGHGMSLTPDYSFADAPQPDIVVIGAQSGGPGLSEWLQKMHQKRALILSVCTGAFKVAKAGLLDGKSATTHHDFYDSFASQFPQVKLVRGVRYVQAEPTILVAGGETSGIDLVLHVLADYYGDAVAQRTADYMEYQGTGWKTNLGVTAAP